MNVPLDRRRVWTLLGLVVYIALFHAAYQVRIAPVFAAVGFPFHDIGWGMMLLLATCALVPGMFLPVEVSRPSQYLAWTFYVLGFIPSCFVPMVASEWTGTSRSLLLVDTAAMSVAFCGVAWLVRRDVRYVVLRRPATTPAVLAAVLALLSLATYALVARYFRSLSLVGLGDVGDLKDNLSDVVASAGPLFGYLMLLQMHTVNPLLIAIGIRHRRAALVTLGGAGQLVFYMAAGVRAVLFTPIILAGAMVTMVRNGRWFSMITTWGVAMIPGIMLLLPTGPDATPTWAIVRLLYWRTLVVPAQIVGLYFDFFSRSPLTLMAHVKGFSLLLKNPYDRPIPVVLAEAYYGQTFSLNGNFFAEGFAGLGIPGLFLVAGVFGLTLLLLDAVTERVDLRLAVLAAGFHALNLTNLSIFTLLLGSGLGMSILLLALVAGTEAPGPARPEARVPANSMS